MLPTFYDPFRVGTLYVPNYLAVTDAARAAGIAPAGEDTTRTLLLLIDAQVDFVHTDGALSVPGAVEDTRRTIEWLYRNLSRVSAIAASLDSHLPVQIFSPSWWVDADGAHPQPFTVIAHEDVVTGRWRALYLSEWSLDYTERLERDAKKQLMIWQYHTLIGTTGHALTPALHEAIVYHAAARHIAPIFLQKGMIAQTEHYSIIEPEVKVPDQPGGDVNHAFLQMLRTYDSIVVAGQAKSHCVLETVTSLMRLFADDPAMISRLNLLTDCMSSVAHPTIDFDVMADAAYADFSTQGLRLITSEMPFA